jgi:hypothetical protein
MKDANGMSLAGTVQLGAGYTWTESKTEHNLVQVCKSAVSDTQCGWATQKDAKPADLCHQVWYADRVLHVYVQAQRECMKWGFASRRSSAKYR